jgi:hypothetical protein
MEMLLIVGVVLLVILIAIVLRAILRVVPHEERRVIYRLGRFHRVVGPGLVLVIPRLEQVVRTIEVRDHPMEITVPGVFAFGVPNDLTLNLWCSFDPAQAAGGDRDKLARLVQIRDGERHRQVEVKMREALVNQISDLQKRMPLPAAATTMDGVIALAPGGPRYRELLEGVKRELEQTLPSVGVILNPAHSIVLTGRNISDEIVEAIKRRRGREIDSEWLTNYVDSLRQRFPGVSNAVLAQMLASIEGVDVGKVQRLLLEHDAGTESEVEFEMARDGEGPNIITRPKSKKQDVASQRQPVRRDTAEEPSSGPSQPLTLTKDDLAVLKRVPRKDRGQRLSA